MFFFYLNIFYIKIRSKRKIKNAHLMERLVKKNLSSQENLNNVFVLLTKLLLKILPMKYELLIIQSL